MAAARELTGLLASGSTIAALDGHYERTIARILDELAQGVSRPGGARAVALLARLRELVNRLDPRKDSFVRTWIKEQLPRAYVLGTRSATRQLQEQLDKVSSDKAAEWGSLKTSWTAANQTTLSAITAAMVSTLSRAARDMMAKLELTVRRTQLRLTTDAAIREATVGGIIRGATGREVSDDIARVILGRANPDALKRLRERGFGGDDLALYQELAKGQLIKVAGKNWGVRPYANLVARTMSRDAHKVGTVVRLQTNGVDHVRISRHIQREADECTPFAGNVYYIGAAEVDPAGFPKLSSILNGGPPFHPNCAHVLEPYVVQLKSPEQIAKDQEQTLALPAKFYSKSGTDIRAMVAESSEKQLNEWAPAGAADISETIAKGVA